MPTFTLETLSSEATALAGGAADLSPSQVSLYVNLAQVEVARSLPMGEMEATTVYAVAASATSIALPDDFDEPIDLARTTYDDIGYRTLGPVPMRYIDDASNGTATGTPVCYAIHGQAGYLYPQPTSALSLTLRYRQVPTDLTASTDVPSLATRFHPAVLYKAAEIVAMRKQDPQTAAFLHAQYLSYIQATPSTQELRVRSEATR